MTQVAAICQALLDGKILSIMTAFKMFSCTNLPREISRGIEQKFNVRISRVRRDFVSQYGQKPGYYFEYRLNKSAPENLDGVKLMRDYVNEQIGLNNGKEKKGGTIVREHTRRTSKEQEPTYTNKLF